jgi:scyllo-inositol 2-dehydrogenase (NADP+)
MTKIALVGLGKMGLSHLSLVRPLPGVEVVGVCDSTGYVLDVLGKYTGLRTFTDYAEMLRVAGPDAVIVATPTHLHEPMVRAALEAGIHVFCEKPLVLDPVQGAALVRLAEEKELVTQVGYHNRHVGSFREAKRLLDLGAVGTVRGALAEAYGPVVVRTPGRSWRSRRGSGGGSLYDYAAHPLDLLTWYLGDPVAVHGAHLTSIHSTETDDAVAATIAYPGATAVLNVNWSDESQRKMSTRITLWGDAGRLTVDRYELQAHLTGRAPVPDGYEQGWNVRYGTDLTPAPEFYVRGEEYSEQLEDFVRRVAQRDLDGVSTFSSALVTDRVIAAIRAADAAPAVLVAPATAEQPAERPAPTTGSTGHDGRARVARAAAVLRRGLASARHAARRAASHRRSA